MIERAFAPANTVICRLDPRARLIVAVAFSVLAAAGSRFQCLIPTLAVGILAICLARPSVAAVARRLAAANIFTVALWLVLPFTVAGATAAHVGSLRVTHEGVVLAAVITLRCNAILMVCMALLATMPLVQLGHALVHLHVPAKLVRVFLLFLRYFSVLEGEYSRLRLAMKVRGFRPRTNRHTYRTLAWLVGMLLVRSLERAERVYAAMKCRGYRGEFYLPHHFSFRWRDAVFVLFAGVLLSVLGAAEWLTTGL